MKYVVDLRSVRSADRALVGGKAAGCAELLRRGYDVPRSFVLTTKAFELFLDRAGLDTKCFYASFRTTDSEERLEAVCVRMQERVRAGALPAEIRTELESLPLSVLAVRSSATAEDAELSAFAGVYESRLRVPRADLARVIVECWAEAFSYGAVTHALRNNLDPRKIRLALLLQEMVEADRSGVLFTQDPSGAGPEIAVLAITSGTGERLMQGEGDDATIQIDRRRPRLSDPLLERLLKQGLRLEAALGHPQDIEWAAKGNTLSYLQTRPISTIERRNGPPILWTREVSEERFPTPMSPLGWSSLQIVLRANRKTLERRFGLKARRPDDIARTIRNYVYTNEEFFAIPGSLRPSPGAQLRFLPRYVGGLLDFLAYAPGSVGKPFGLRRLALTRFFRAFIFGHAREVLAGWDRQLPGLLLEIDEFNRADLRAMSAEDLERHYRKMEGVADRYMEPDLAIYVIKVACQWMLEKIGEKIHGRKDREFLTALTGGLSDNRTLRMNTDLEELFEAVQKDPRLLAFIEAERYDDALARLRGETARAFERFVDRNGHTTTNWDLREPTWGEAPEKILALLRTYALAGRRRDHRTLQEDRLRRYRDVRRDALGALRGSPWMRAFFEELLDTLHAFMRIDEEHHFYCSRLFKPIRAFFGEIGSRFAAARLIEEPADIYFLTLSEVREILRNLSTFPRRYLVGARRAAFARSAAVRPPDRFRGQAPLPTDGMPALVGTELCGVGASPGEATGVVRVVQTPEQVSQFQAGEILVTASPNPAWTPMYAVASGLITSTGSILSHGLVSAREYQLPAVIGIADAPNRFATGQKVRIDGDKGTVSFVFN